MHRLLPALLACVLAGPVAADEFTDVVESALTAYREGNVTGAREDLDYAVKLLNEVKAASLAKFLPEPFDGWTRTVSDNVAGSGIAMTMLGGGTMTSASYSKGTEELNITLMANSPLISGMAAMISGVGTLGAGKPLRIQRTEFGQADGELQGVIGGKVMVTVSGNAPIEIKTAHLEKMEFAALAEF